MPHGSDFCMCRSGKGQGFSYKIITPGTEIKVPVMSLTEIGLSCKLLLGGINFIKCLHARFESFCFQPFLGISADYLYINDDHE